MPLRAASTDDAQAIARVHVQGWRDTYPGIVPPAEIDRRSEAEYGPKWRAWLADPAKTGWVWEVDDRIVGFAFIGPARDDAPGGYAMELLAIYLDRSEHRRGIGQALFEACREGAGAGPMMLWVLEENPACAFYERMGGRIIARREEEIGGAKLWERAYGWGSSVPPRPLPDSRKG